MKWTANIILCSMLAGCSTVDMIQYRKNEPQFDLFDYFHGNSKGWGIVQNRKGALTRQFNVDITGTINADGDLVLKEDFDWNDGEQTSRTWIISKQNTHTYYGTAEDVVAGAKGILYGNVLNWEYQLNLEIDATTWKINFSDWMFLVDRDLLLNKASMTKFGFKVGEVTIIFQKSPRRES